MATIIDALVIELGLDPRGVTAGRKKAAEELLAMRKGTEQDAKVMAESLNRVRNEVLAMFAAFTAGKGLKEFLQEVIATDADLGRFAVSLDTTTEKLSALRGLAAANGGSADGITGTVKGLTRAFQQFALTGESSIIPYLRTLKVSMVDVNTGKMKDMTQFLLELSDSVQGMDKAKAATLLAGMGIDEGTINIMLRGRAAMQAMLEDQKKWGVVTKEDAIAGAELQYAMAGVEQSSTSLGRTLLTMVAPVLIRILDGFTAIAVFVRAHMPFVEVLVSGLAIAIGVLGGVMAVAAGTFLGLTAPIWGTVAAIVAASVAVGLLYEDWKTWTQGGKSAFADFWQSVSSKWDSFFSVVRPALDAVSLLFKDFVGTLSDALKAVWALFFGTGDQIRAAWGKLFLDLETDAMHFFTRLPLLANAVGYAMARALAGGLNYFQGRINSIWNAITGHDLFKQHDFEAPPPKAPPKWTGMEFNKNKTKSSEPATAGATAAITAVLKNEDSALSGKVTNDTGGITKYGIASKSHPGVDVANLTLDQAKAIYKSEYWDKIGGDKLPAALQKTALDAAINQSVGNANKWIAQSGGDVNKFNALRRQQYETLLAENPQKYGKYEHSWMSRLPPTADAPQVQVAGGSGRTPADIAANGAPLPGPVQVANAAPQAASISNGSPIQRTSTVTSETNIDKLIVQTAATDSAGIARDLKPELQRTSFAAQATYAAT